jgi:hypothetical protein
MEFFPMRWKRDRFAGRDKALGWFHENDGFFRDCVSQFSGMREVVSADTEDTGYIESVVFHKGLLIEFLRG